MLMQKDTMKVLFIARSMRGGGAERFLAILLKHIDRTRFSPSLALVENEGPFLGDLPEDIEVIDLKAGRVRYALPKIVGLVREKTPNVIFCCIGYLTIAVIMARPLIPREVKIIGRETNIPSINIWQSPFPRLLRFLYRWLYPRLDMLVCQSVDMRDDLTKLFSFPSSKAIIVNNPVDMDEIRKRAQDGEQVFRQGRFNILAAGNFTYQKGFDLLLQSMAQLKTKNWHLTILGEGAEENTLKLLAKELNLSSKMTFAGFVSNPYPYMAKADLFVLSSRFEGFPNVALEAMACGTPVVAFDCPGGINEIIEDGVNGLRVEPGNVTGFADGVERSLKARWDEDLIKKSVEKKCGVEKIVAEYERVFLEVLNAQKTKS